LSRVAEVKIGTAGWTVPRQYADDFPAEGTSLQRYATRFRVAEVNSSFHRPHRQSTWERWRDSVPPSFRFSAKLPKEITHQRKLVDCGEPIDGFAEQVTVLGEKLAIVLVQLPPKLSFDELIVRSFFRRLRDSCSARIACEPRNASWFTPAVDDVLKELRVARVAADPAICPEAAVPGGWGELSYWRLHGSPVVYRSSYGDRVTSFAGQLKRAAQSADVWCIFDNTASSAAMGDALRLTEELSS
jgi:uncharacterized protein YecE (DUF72 family)